MIGASAPIAVTRAAWATTPGTVLAGALNVTDVGNQGTSFIAPVGQNVTHFSVISQPVDDLAASAVPPERFKW